MAGKLYLCATPIGNLDDMTFRVLETLKSVDLIAAEDTRNSIKLLNHFDIHTEMTSYHEYNKYDKAQYLIGKMQEGLKGFQQDVFALKVFCHHQMIRRQEREFWKISRMRAEQ